MTDIPRSTLDELRRLSAAATPGEWSAHDYRSDPSQEDWFGVIKGAFDIEGKCHQIGAFKFSALPSKENWANAQLIAAMRNSIDALLDALEAAQANERRYLWLKQSSWTIKRYVPAVYQDVAVSGGDLDAAIDAAMGGENGN